MVTHRFESAANPGPHQPIPQGGKPEIRIPLAPREIVSVFQARHQPITRPCTARCVRTFAQLPAAVRARRERYAKLAQKTEV